MRPLRDSEDGNDMSLITTLKRHLSLAKSYKCTQSTKVRIQW